MKKVFKWIKRLFVKPKPTKRQWINTFYILEGKAFEFNNILFTLEDRKFKMRPFVNGIKYDHQFPCKDLKPYPFMTLKNILRGKWGKRHEND